MKTLKVIVFASLLFLYSLSLSSAVEENTYAIRGFLPGVTAGSMGVQLTAKMQRGEVINYFAEKNGAELYFTRDEKRLYHIYYKEEYEGSADYEGIINAAKKKYGDTKSVGLCGRHGHHEWFTPKGKLKLDVFENWKTVQLIDEGLFFLNQASWRKAVSLASP